MKTRQSQTDYSPKPRGQRFWIGCFTILLGLPFLLYYGYCWGLWGRSSLLLKYLFQCSCPPASEEARYPDEVDVIVPACRNGGVQLSPSGRLLYVREKNGGLDSTYLLDLQTQEKIQFAIPEGCNYFLTDNLVFLSLDYGGGEYILDRTTEEQYPIQRFTSLHPDVYVNGDVDLNLLAEALHEAEYVFLIDDNDAVVALAPDFPTSSERNFLISRFDIPGMSPNRVEQFLQEYQVVYQLISVSFPEEVISPDGRFVARTDGIYLVQTGQKIVEGYASSKSYRAYSRKYFAVRGWTYDGTGVIYSKFLNPCLVETNFFIFDDPSCYYEVPQPVILLKVPEEHLLPVETP
ncbi:MAG TPA: hypothetical protein VFR47_00345 [Anaerolineales bacterium]|nr:hypothetical protein [Anaerolineales bacterium]